MNSRDIFPFPILYLLEFKIIVVLIKKNLGLKNETISAIFSIQIAM